MRALRLRLCVFLLFPWLAGGCAMLKVDPLPEPIRPPRAVAESVAADETAPPTEAPADAPRTVRTPGVVIQHTVAEGIADRLGENLVGDPVRVSFHNVPLIPFINEVFGEELGMSFVISPGLREKTDLVTLRLTEPLPPSQLFAAVRRVLREYGVDLREEEEGILTFAASKDTASRDVPLLVSGRTLPEVPASHRTIFQLVPLKVVRGPQIRGWLKKAFDRQDLEIFEDPERNALLLKGNADTLARALAMIEVLDQPLLRGQHGIIIEPEFMDANELAAALNSVLRAEGYQSSLGARATAGSVIFIALAGINKVVAFAADQDTIDHVEKWALALDTRRKESIEEAVFTYEVRNTQAGDLNETLSQLLGTRVAATPTPEPANGEDRENSKDLIQPPQGGEWTGARIVVDKNRNTLLFRGSGKEWAEIRAVIKKLDRSIPSVLNRGAHRRSHSRRRGKNRARVPAQGDPRRSRNHRPNPRHARGERPGAFPNPGQLRRDPGDPESLLQGRPGRHPLPAAPSR